MAEGVPSPELKPMPGKAVEREFKQETIIQSFNSALTELESASTKAKAPLSPEDKHTLAEIRTAKADTLDKKRDSFENVFEDVDNPGGEFRQLEGIPVEGLIDFIRRKADSLPKGDPQRRHLLGLANTLYKNSLPYYEIQGGRRKPGQKLNRIRQEAYFISKDARATVPHSAEGDFLKAISTLNGRRELIIPPKKPKAKTTPSPSPSPTPPPAPTPVPISGGGGAPPSPDTIPPAPGLEARPPVPDYTPVRDVVYEFGIANGQSLFEKRKGEIATEQLTEEQRRGKWYSPKDFLRKMKLRLWEEGYRQVYKSRVGAAILANDNTSLQMDVVKNNVTNATANIDKVRAEEASAVQRVKEGGLIAGERVLEAEGPLKQKIREQILTPLVEGRLNHKQLQDTLRRFITDNAADPQIAEIFGRDATRYGKLAEYFGSDLEQMAAKIREDGNAHRFALGEIDNLVTIKLANIEWAAETEVVFNRTDRAIAWAQRHKAGGLFLNPAAIGFIASSVAMVPAMGARAGIAATGFGALSGGLFSALRRNKDLQVDRAAHEVGRTYNMQIEPGSRRREALEKFAYDRVSDDVLLKRGVERRTIDGDTRSLEELLTLDFSNTEGGIRNRAALLRRKAEIGMRLDFSAEQKIDLITFSGREGVETGRLELTRGMGRANQVLKIAGMTGEQITEAENGFAGEWRSRLLTNKSEQDRSFRWFRVRNAVGSGIFGTVAGLSGGLASQEVFAVAGRAVGMNVAPTYIEGALGFKPSTPGLHAEAIADISKLQDTRLPNGMRLHYDPGGETASVIGADNKGIVGLRHLPIEDGKIIGEGELPQSVKDDLAEAKLEFDESVKKFPGTTEKIDVKGPDGKIEDIGTEVDHTEWYSYDKPGSQGNELKAYTSLNKNGTLVLDGSHMEMAHQKGLKPNPIDVQQVIKDREMVFAFSLPGDPDTKIVVPDGVDGKWDGKLNLAEGSTRELFTTDGKPVMVDGHKLTLGDLRELVVNEKALSKLSPGNIGTEYYQRRDVFNLGRGDKMGWWQVGRLADETANGKPVFQSFATGRGSSEFSGEMTVGRPAASVTKFEIGMPKPPEVPLPPPTPGEPFEMPPIAIPFSPRHPLEALVGGTKLPENPIAGYYGGGSLKEGRDWLIAHPKAHEPHKRITDKDGKVLWVDKEGRPIIRDVERERTKIREYLSDLETEDPAYRGEIDRLAESIAPMKKETRVAVNIPAWMEGKNLYHLLEEYTRQVDSKGNPLDPGLYEINIIVNRKTGSPADNSVSKIQRFISDTGGRFQINFVDIEFPEPFNNVGNARKVITDITLQRSVARGKQDGSLYIESEDADLINVDPRTVINLIGRLDSNPHLDAVRGMQDRLPEKMMENDYLFLARRMHDFKEYIIRRKAYRVEVNPRANYTWNRVITGGWNTGFTAEGYALIGGYSRYQTKGEDLTIGEHLTMARGDGNLPNTDIVGKVPTRSDSSPRRFIWEIASGKGAYDEGFEDPVVNADIRNATTEELLGRVSFVSRINDSNMGSFGALVNNEYNFIKATTPDATTAQKVTQEVLTYIGLKKGDYRFTEDGRLEVSNWSNLQQALNDYRAKHPAPKAPGQRTRARVTPPAPSSNSTTLSKVSSSTKTAATGVVSRAAATAAPLEASAPIETPKAEKINYDTEYLERFKRVKLEAEARGLRYEHPSKAGIGWKIHLAVPHEPSDTLTAKIANFLDSKRVLFKIGKGGTQEEGKGMTIYVGDRDSMEDLANEINATFGSEIPEQRGGALKSDMPIVGNVWARFENMRDFIKNKDNKYVQYGPSGVPALFVDATNSQWGSPENKPTREIMRNNSITTLTEDYGTFFTGTREHSLEATIPAPAPTSPTPSSTALESTVPVPEPAKPTETEPKTLLERAQKVLRESGGTTAQFEATPVEVIDYLKTLPLPSGAKIVDASSSITGGQLTTSGRISTPGGEIKFQAILENDPSGRLIVKSKKIDMPFLVKMAAGGQIESRIGILNELILQQLSTSIDPAWSATGLQIVGDKVAVNFSKR